MATENTSEYKEKADDEVKEKINKYYKDKSVQFITKEKLLLTIIKIWLNIKMNEKREKLD